jgi:hypothetical protein
MPYTVGTSAKPPLRANPVLHDSNHLVPETMLGLPRGLLLVISIHFRGTMPKAIPNPGLPHAENGTQAQAPRRGELPNEASGPTDWSALALGDEETPTTMLDEATLADARTSSPEHAWDVDGLLAENSLLRSSVEDLQARLQQANETNEQAWLERHQEYERLLEEKSELIRSLHFQFKEAQDARAAIKPTPKEEELLAFSEELERERCQLDQDRRQAEELRQRLTEDEQEMLRQMREMEVQMARERADFARQRTELQRILDDIRRELENIERNGHLNQRLGQLRQRFQDVALARPGSLSGSVKASLSKTPPPGEKKATSVKSPVAEKAASTAANKDSSVLRRLFGKRGS